MRIRPIPWVANLISNNGTVLSVPTLQPKHSASTEAIPDSVV